MEIMMFEVFHGHNWMQTPSQRNNDEVHRQKKRPAGGSGSTCMPLLMNQFLSNLVSP